MVDFRLPVYSPAFPAPVKLRRGRFNAGFLAVLSSAASDAHVAGNGGYVAGAVDDEVVALGLAGDRLFDDAR